MGTVGDARSDPEFVEAKPRPWEAQWKACRPVSAALAERWDHKMSNLDVACQPLHVSHVVVGGICPLNDISPTLSRIASSIAGLFCIQQRLENERRHLAQVFKRPSVLSHMAACMAFRHRES